jgi:hypothetical protein
MTQHLRRQSSSTYRLQGYERSMRGAIYIWRPAEWALFRCKCQILLVPFLYWRNLTAGQPSYCRERGCTHGSRLPCMAPARLLEEKMTREGWPKRKVIIYPDAYRHCVHDVHWGNVKHAWYTGRKISANVSYVTVRGYGKMERARGEQDALWLSLPLPPRHSAGRTQRICSGQRSSDKYIVGIKMLALYWPPYWKVLKKYGSCNVYYSRTIGSLTISKVTNYVHSDTLEVSNQDSDVW